MAGTNQTFRDNLLRVVAVLGLLAILLLGAWGIIQVAFFISGLFTNSSETNNTPAPAAHEIVTISMPASALPGQNVAVNWKHQGGAGAYAYAVSYACADGLSIKAPLPTGALQAVPCNTPFNYTNASTSMSLTPAYSGSTDAHTAITITATQLSTGKITASATGNLTVTATKTAKPTTTTSGTTAPKSTYVPSGRTQNLYGYADLAVSITSAYSRNNNTVVQFVIQNVGTNVTPGTWTFSAIIPWQGSYTYPAGPQRALYPGDRIEYTLAYGGDSGYGYGYTPTCFGYTGNCIGSATYGQQTVSVSVDPYNQLTELTKANNYASASYPAH